MSEKQSINDDSAYVLDEQIGYLLRLAHQRHTAIFQKLIEKRLTPTQFSALVRLSINGACSQNHLGRLSAMDVATIKGVVDRLRSKGLVNQTPDTKDRRRMLVELTEQGQVLCDELLVLGRQISEETLAPLTKTERKQLIKLLKKIA